VLKDRGIRRGQRRDRPGAHVVLMRSDAASARTLLRRHSFALTQRYTMKATSLSPMATARRHRATAAGVFYGAQTVKQL